MTARFRIRVRSCRLLAVRNEKRAVIDRAYSKTQSRNHFNRYSALVS
jgi:hypothetical protein